MPTFTPSDLKGIHTLDLRDNHIKKLKLPVNLLDMKIYVMGNQLSCRDIDENYYRVLMDLTCNVGGHEYHTDVRTPPTTSGTYSLSNYTHSLHEKNTTKTLVENPGAAKLTLYIISAIVIIMVPIMLIIIIRIKCTRNNNILLHQGPAANLHVRNIRKSDLELNESDDQEEEEISLFEQIRKSPRLAAKKEHVV